MSFKIFSLQFFGKIKPTETIEKRRQELGRDYAEFLQVAQSAELADYFELEKFLQSEPFKTKKAEIEALQFKGSKPYNQLAEFTRLKKKPAIRKYFKIAGSQDLKQFENFKSSEKLREFDALQAFVNEGQYEKEKHEIVRWVFKGSVEEQHWRDFKKMTKLPEIKAFKALTGSAKLKKHNDFTRSEKLAKFMSLRNSAENDKQKNSELKKLKRDPEIKGYFKFEESKQLKLYRETVDSHQLKKYEDLKAYVESRDFEKQVAFLKDKTKLQNSKTFKKYKKYKALAADADVKFFLKFEKSAGYKNYLDVAGSFDLKRYWELNEIVKSKAYADQKAYLEDKNKWQKTAEYAKQQELESLKKQPGIALYFKYKNSTEFDFFRQWEPVFEDGFSGKENGAGEWAAKSYVGEKMLGDNYSMPGDLNAFTSGKNITTDDVLKIAVRKEKTVAKVWQMPAGFVPREMDYSSGLLSSWKNFWHGDGIVEAKIFFGTQKEVVNTFFLAGENNMPRVNLLEMGTKNKVGLAALDKDGKVQAESLDISKLKKNRWYIFGIEKEGKKITWKINDVEIFSVQDANVPNSLHLNFSSLVVHEIPAGKLPVEFKVEWVKCYRKK